MVDAEFGDPRLAALYDVLDHDRRDLDLYVDLAVRSGARTVVDIGCGTGVLALRLAARGLQVTGVDPARASLDVARGKPGAADVRWVDGDIGALDLAGQDLATMTGNAAQAITADEEWRALLAGVHRTLRPGGLLVFESRNPAARAWEGWTRAATLRHTPIPGVGTVTDWTEVLEAPLPLVAFRSSWTFAEDGTTLTSTSTLRFRGLEELRSDSRRAGFDVLEVLDAPDRPGKELVLVCRTT